MYIIAASDNGLLKTINLKKNRVIKTYGEQRKNNETTSIALNQIGKDRGVCAAFGKEEGRIEYFDLTKPWEEDSNNIMVKLKNKVIGMDFPKNSPSNLICSTMNGSVYRIPISERYNPPSSENMGSYEESIRSRHHILSTHHPLEKMKLLPDGASLVSGGENADLKMWDLQTGQATWSAKNVRMTKVRLSLPIWVTDIAVNASIPSLLFTTSRHGHFRAYDTRLAPRRRPIVSFRPLGEGALLCCDISADGGKICVGNAMGRGAILDVRNISIQNEDSNNIEKKKKKNKQGNEFGFSSGGAHEDYEGKKYDNGGRLSGILKGASGAIRGVTHGTWKTSGNEDNDDGGKKTIPVFCITGLDRHIRVYSHNKAPITKVYVKQRMNHIISLNDEFIEMYKEDEKEIRKLEKKMRSKNGGNDSDDDDDENSDDENSDEDEDEDSDGELSDSSSSSSSSSNSNSAEEEDKTVWKQLRNKEKRQALERKRKNKRNLDENDQSDPEDDLPEDDDKKPKMKRRRKN